MRVIIVLAVLVAISSCGRQEGSETRLFEKRTVFENEEMEAPWAKFIGDLDGNGEPEFYVGFHGSGHLLEIREDGSISRPVGQISAILTDGGIADLDGDGINDIVLATERGVMAFFAPQYAAATLFPGRIHDVRFLDDDGDGFPEILIRNQTAFGKGTGDLFILSSSSGAAPWNTRVLVEANGEGMEVADIDADGDLDIALPRIWLENGAESDWIEHRYTDSWNWPHAKVAIGDIDGDGSLDIALAPAEPADQYYKVAWYEQNQAQGSEWPEHVVVDKVESVVHSLQVGDVDMDGNTDIVYAEMHQGEDPDEVILLRNQGRNRAWIRSLIDDRGSHNLQLFDRDSDGDLDLAGGNWSGEEQGVHVWTNTVCDAPWAAWTRHLIDGKRPGRAVFINSADLNSDNWPDIVSGSAAYINPGLEDQEWKRISFNGVEVDAASPWDVDGDGDMDVLAAVGEMENRRFQVFMNDGKAEFQAHDTGIVVSGDFLQGVAKLTEVDTNAVLLSWHEAGHGVELLAAPEDGRQGWRLLTLSKDSQDEALSSADLDQDGDTDVLLGTQWLRNDGVQWNTQTIDTTRTPPDRNRLADINGDGKLDAVVGFEAISSAGDIVWYEQSHNGWVRHHVGTIVGPMSLDVADMDGDGDLDIITGEHNLDDPASAALWIFENVDGSGRRWNGHRIHVGDEHHDGTQTVDIDLDGDLDIVSIGWGHNNVIWYENKMPKCPKISRSGD